MNLKVEYVIYSYVVICLLLLVYNVIYMIRSGARGKHQDKQAGRWQQEIRQQSRSLEEGEGISPEHIRRMERKLAGTENLLAFGTALERLEEERCLAGYIQAVYSPLQQLAARYTGKNSMDRAYFAYLISRHWSSGDSRFQPVMEILLSYMDNSTVYCRENVLNALYALGNVQAVENAFSLLNDRKIFHHQKLLSDGLLSFRGDREELAGRLWSHLGHWEENLMLAVAAFINGFSDSYRETFLPLLKEHNISLEIRLAVMRYYRRHAYEPARPLLLDFLTQPGIEDSIATVAAFVLDRYPGPDTVAALKKGLTHRNWYVRYNSASSLVSLGISGQDIQDILGGKDRYAKEILGYMLEERKAGEGV